MKSKNYGRFNSFSILYILCFEVVHIKNVIPAPITIPEVTSSGWCLKSLILEPQTYTLKPKKNEDSNATNRSWDWHVELKKNAIKTPALVASVACIDGHEMNSLFLLLPCILHVSYVELYPHLVYIVGRGHPTYAFAKEVKDDDKQMHVSSVHIAVIKLKFLNNFGKKCCKT